MRFATARWRGWSGCGAFALAGVGLFAGTLFDTLCALRFSRRFAGTVAVLVALSPACGVYAAWTAGMFSPYALLAALLAGRLLNRPGGLAARGRRGTFTGRVVRGLAGGGAVGPVSHAG